jgi:hypothetical protein
MFEQLFFLSVKSKNNVETILNYFSVASRQDMSDNTKTAGNSKSSESKKGFGYLRRQVINLQNKNNQLESNVMELTETIERLKFRIDELKGYIVYNSLSSHYKYICDRIREKIQDSLVWPSRKRNDMIFDKETGIKFEIKKIKKDDDVINTNIVHLNENLKATHTYEVRFYVFAKYVGFSKNFQLLPAFEEEDSEDSIYIHPKSKQFIDIFGYNFAESCYFPRTFYETVDDQGVTDVAEFF